MSTYHRDQPSDIDVINAIKHDNLDMLKYILKKYTPGYALLYYEIIKANRYHLFEWVSSQDTDKIFDVCRQMIKYNRFKMLRLAFDNGFVLNKDVFNMPEYHVNENMKQWIDERLGKQK